MKTTVLLAAALALCAAAAEAQEVTLKAVTAFAEKTQFSKNFERFIDKVNADGKGVVQINYIGGPRAMPPFEVGNAVRTKVIDIANVTGAFYTNLMPEADAFKLIGKPGDAQRKDGTFAFIEQLHNDKLNAHGFFPATASKQRSNAYGFTMGGPENSLARRTVYQ